MSTLRLAPVFQSGAVLQRHMRIPVWGLARPGAAVEVRLGEATAVVAAADDGRWLLRLPPRAAGGPFDLAVHSEGESVEFHDILVGDVWLCSGQSNAAWLLHQTDPDGGHTVGVHLPNLRLLTLSTPCKIGRQTAVDGCWTTASADSLPAFSAIGGWFGRIIHQNLGIPIGIIANAWGGTRIQAWMSREALMTDPDGREEVAAGDAEAFLKSLPEVKSYTSLDEWAHAEGPKDAGNRGLAEGWAEPGLDEQAWKAMDLPGHWQKQGHPGSGVLWFRKTIDIPSHWLGRDLTLRLGAIDKHDDTYVNGIRIGGISWENPNAWCTPRSYRVPAAVVGETTRMVVAVRARSHVYDGGLTGPAHAMCLQPADEASGLPLAGRWLWKVEQDWGQVAAPPQFGNGPATPNAPHAMFDCRLNPLIPYGLRGVLWYQGESTREEPDLYRRLLPLMISDWRRAWGLGAFPFIQVQLANYLEARSDPGDSNLASLRDAQTNALTIPGVGMAVAIDVGDTADIHPQDKKSVGERLARWALAEVYRRGGTPCGPLYAGMTSEDGGRIRIRFRHATRLHTRDNGPVRHVAIAGRRRGWYWAEAVIEGETLVVHHPDVPDPCAVRYAWADNPEGCNLVNGDDLPASPFDTDTTPPL